MENFKQASKEKLRFVTNKGVLSTEQLWDLTLDELDSLVVSLEALHKESGKKSFLIKTSVKDKTAKLKFDVALEVLTTKLEEESALLEAREVKAHNEKIITLIAEKQDETLKGKSISQLKSMLK